jgi:hypothetical protein
MSSPQPDRPTIPLAKQDVNVVEVKPIAERGGQWRERTTQSALNNESAAHAFMDAV